MERQISIDPQKFLLFGVVLLIVYVLSLVLQGPFTFLGIPVVVLIGILVVFQRYFSDITLENIRFRQASEITFQVGIVAILGAYVVFFVTGSVIGEVLFALSISILCVYLSIPGLVERFTEQ